MFEFFFFLLFCFTNEIVLLCSQMHKDIYGFEWKHRRHNSKMENGMQLKNSWRLNEKKLTKKAQKDIQDMQDANLY